MKDKLYGLLWGVMLGVMLSVLVTGMILKEQKQWWTTKCESTRKEVQAEAYERGYGTYVSDPMGNVEWRWLDETDGDAASGNR